MSSRKRAGTGTDSRPAKRAKASNSTKSQGSVAAPARGDWMGGGTSKTSTKSNGKPSTKSGGTKPKSGKTLQAQKASGKGVKRKMSTADGEASDEQHARKKKRAVKAEKALSRKERKSLKAERQKAKPNYDVVSEAKKIWEQVRIKRGNKGALPEAERQQRVNDLCEMLRGKVFEVGSKHDGSRVVQWALKLGSREQAKAIFSELKGHFVDLARGVFSKHVVSAVLKHCQREERDVIIRELYGHVRTLLKHRTACEALDSVFGTYANMRQRRDLVSELYGPTFRLIKSAHSPSLSEFLAEHPEKRAATLKFLGEALTSALDKGTIRYSIVHAALLEYLIEADAEDKLTMIRTLKENLVEILHTKDGARCTILALSHGTPKDRKAIVKSFKSYVPKISKEEFGHLVLMRLFDVVDDTVLLKKSIASELIPVVPELVRDRYGSRVLLHLLAPRSRRHFTPFALSLLPLTDSQGQPFSKKDPEVRRQEILEPLVAPLLDALNAAPGELLRDPSGSALIAEALWKLNTTAAGDAVRQLLDSVVALVDAEDEEPAEEGADAPEPVLSDGIASRALRAIIRKPPTGADVARLVMDKVAGALFDLAANGSRVVDALLLAPSTAEQAKAELRPRLKDVRALAGPDAAAAEDEEADVDEDEQRVRSVCRSVVDILEGRKTAAALDAESAAEESAGDVSGAAADEDGEEEDGGTDEDEDE